MTYTGPIQGSAVRLQRMDKSQIVIVMQLLRVTSKLAELKLYH